MDEIKATGKDFFDFHNNPVRMLALSDLKEKIKTVEKQMSNMDPTEHGFVQKYSKLDGIKQATYEFINWLESLEERSKKHESTRN